MAKLSDAQQAFVRENDYRWLAVSGPVTLITDGAVDDIQFLSQKYDGHEFRSLNESETRVTALVTPEKVTSRGI